MVVDSHLMARYLQNSQLEMSVSLMLRGGFDVQVGGLKPRDVGLQTIRHHVESQQLDRDQSGGVVGVKFGKKRIHTFSIRSCQAHTKKTRLSQNYNHHLLHQVLPSTHKEKQVICTGSPVDLSVHH